MKRFIQKGIIFSITLVAVILVLILTVIIRLHKMQDRYSMAFFTKQEMLKSSSLSDTSSIILLGGSNVAYGFNSKILQDSLKKPVINIGLGAGNGLKFMIDHTKGYLKPGDILIISPEYEHFFNKSAYGNGSSLADLFFTEPKLGRYFNIKQWYVIAYGIKNLCRDQLVPARKSKFVAKVTDFNVYGDVIKHWGMQSFPHGQSSLGDFTRINTVFLEYYSQTISELRSCGVVVMIIPPSISDKSYEIIKTKLHQLTPELDKRDIGLAAPIEEFVYPDSLFFDTHHHLGYSGVLLRTARVLEIIRSCN